nr:unnamed protein product [Callosobruchus analis]
MSRDAYGGGSRSPRGVRLPTVDRSPSRVAYHPSATGGGGGSPVGRKPTRQSRSGNNSPTDHSYGYHHSSPYYRDDDLGSPMLLEEGRGRPITVGPPHHRSRSATRTSNPMSVRYQSLDRGPTMDHERDKIDPNFAYLVHNSNIFFQIGKTVTYLPPTIHRRTTEPKFRPTTRPSQFEEGARTDEPKIRLLHAFHKDLLESRTQKRKGASERRIGQIQNKQCSYDN